MSSALHVAHMGLEKKKPHYDLWNPDMNWKQQWSFLNTTAGIIGFLGKHPLLDFQTF